MIRQPSCAALLNNNVHINVWSSLAVADYRLAADVSAAQAAWAAQEAAAEAASRGSLGLDPWYQPLLAGADAEVWGDDGRSRGVFSFCQCPGGAKGGGLMGGE